MNINREALEAQKAGVAAMKQATQNMGGVDAVEEMMDQVEEGLVDADEIGQALGRSVAMPGLDADEDDMLAELEVRPRHASPSRPRAADSARFGRRAPPEGVDGGRS